MTFQRSETASASGRRQAWARLTLGLVHSLSFEGSQPQALIPFLSFLSHTFLAHPIWLCFTPGSLASIFCLLMHVSLLQVCRSSFETGLTVVFRRRLEWISTPLLRSLHRNS